MFQGYFLVEVMFQGYFFNCNRSVFKNWPPRPIIGQLKQINNDFDYDFTVEVMRPLSRVTNENLHAEPTLFFWRRK